MPIARELLTVIARRNPAVFDLIGPVALNPQPLPPIDTVALNPQPLPPIDTVALTPQQLLSRVSLNPQPLPPVDGLNPQPIPPEAEGVLVARRLLDLAWAAQKLNVELAPIADWEDDPCPVGERVPVIPPGLPPIPDPEPGPEWRQAYLLAVASTLAASAHPAIAESRFVTSAIAHTVEAFEQVR